jgi:hypothetical protein
MLILIAFLCGLSLDLVWAACVGAVQSRRPLLAANLSILIYLCTLVSTVLIVDKEIIACVAYALGGWAGTYLAVRKR